MDQKYGFLKCKKHEHGMLHMDLCISECNIPISCSSVHRCSFLGIHIFTKNATFPGKRKAWIFLVFNM